MTKVHDEVLAANQAYAKDFGNKAKLAMPPARRFAILTCMDARLDPAKFADLAEGDAHVIRNAGGRASDDAIRSLVISHKLLGTNEWFVIHHTDCDMETFGRSSGSAAGPSGCLLPAAYRFSSELQSHACRRRRSAYGG